MNRGPDGRAPRRSRTGPLRDAATPVTCRQLVSAHIEQASITTKPATPIQVYLDTTPAMRKPTPSTNPIAARLPQKAAHPDPGVFGPHPSNEQADAEHEPDRASTTRRL